MENSKSAQIVQKNRRKFKFLGSPAAQERKENFINALTESAGQVNFACKQAGIDRRSYRRWKEKDPVFKEAIEDLKEDIADNVEAHLLKLIESGKETSTIFYLKTKCKDRGYTEKQEIQHSGTVGGGLTIRLVKPDGTEYKSNT